MVWICPWCETGNFTLEMHVPCIEAATRHADRMEESRSMLIAERDDLKAEVERLRRQTTLPSTLVDKADYDALGMEVERLRTVLQDIAMCARRALEDK